MAGYLAHQNHFVVIAVTSEYERAEMGKHFIGVPGIGIFLHEEVLN